MLPWPVQRKAERQSVSKKSGSVNELAVLEGFDEDVIAEPVC